MSGKISEEHITMRYHTVETGRTLGKRCVDHERGEKNRANKSRQESKDVRKHKNERNKT